MNNIFSVWVSACTLLLLSACSEADVKANSEGSDPETKIENKVGHKNTSADFYFGGQAKALDHSLRQKLGSISPEAVENISVEIPATQPNVGNAKTRITRALGNLGYSVPVVFERSESLVADHVKIHVGYVAVVSPNCPDWSKSSSNNFENENFSNIGCATTTNLGLMLVDPRDLERGSGGNISPDSNRAADAVKNYRNELSGSGGSSADVPTTTSVTN